MVYEENLDLVLSVSTFDYMYNAFFKYFINTCFGLLQFLGFVLKRSIVRENGIYISVRIVTGNHDSFPQIIQFVCLLDLLLSQMLAIQKPYQSP